jgi:uncharacterized membrane protein YhaH (DUF805 family)
MNPYEPPKSAGSNWGISAGRWLMADYRLSRLPFAVLSFAHDFWFMEMLGSGEWRKALWALLSMPLVLVCVVLPRLRDCDWPLWVAVLTLVPYLGVLTGLGLLLVPSKSINRKNDESSSEAQPLD